MLPPPTDDELLKAFVDDCPSMAADDYRARTGLWDVYAPPIEAIRELFRSEWEKRYR